MAIVGLPLPIQLLNGNVADGGQVMTDLNAIASNVNANAAKNGVNNDITQLLALTSLNPGLTITGATIANSTINGGTMTATVLSNVTGTLVNVTITGGFIIGMAIDATTTVPTAAPGTATNQIASTAFVINTAFSAALPAQAGNAGKFVTTNGTVASWSFIDLTTSVVGILPPVNGGTPPFLLFAQGVI